MGSFNFRESDMQQIRNELNKISTEKNYTSTPITPSRKQPRKSLNPFDEINTSQKKGRNSKVLMFGTK
jgi:hypothetical protein